MDSLVASKSPKNKTRLWYFHPYITCSKSKKNNIASSPRSVIYKIPLQLNNSHFYAINFTNSWKYEFKDCLETGDEIKVGGQ